MIRDDYRRLTYGLFYYMDIPKYLFATNFDLHLIRNKFIDDWYKYYYLENEDTIHAEELL